MMIFLEDNSQIKFSRLRKGKKVLVLVIYNKSIFNANDKKRKIQKKKGKSPLQSKEKGKGIMISKFLTLIKKLSVFDSMPNYQLSQNKDYLLNKN